MQSMFAVVGAVWVAVLLGVFAQPVSAADAVTVVRSGTPHDVYFAIEFDGDAGLVAGSGERILNSVDGGRHWTRTDLGGGGALLGVALRGTHQIAVGQSGLIYSRSGDDAWTRRDSGSDERLMDVSVNADGLAFAVGAFGTVLVSRDGGASWAPAHPDWDTAVNAPVSAAGLGPSLYAVDVRDNGEVTVAGEWGIVLRSDDAGTSWRTLHHGDTAAQEGDATLFALDSDGNGTLIAVGQEGAMLRSDDDGATWQRVEAETPVNLLGVSLGTNGWVLASGMREMLISRDRGHSWQPVYGADIAIGWYSGISMPSGGDTFYAVGHAGRMLAIAASN